MSVGGVGVDGGSVAVTTITIGVGGVEVGGGSVAVTTITIGVGGGSVAVTTTSGVERPQEKSVIMLSTEMIVTAFNFFTIVGLERFGGLRC